MQGRPQSTVALKTWPEAERADRIAFANLSEYRLPVASVVLPGPRSATSLRAACGSTRPPALARFNFWPSPKRKQLGGTMIQDVQATRRSKIVPPWPESFDFKDFYQSLHSCQ